MAKRKNEDPSPDNLDPQNDADNFGLPDLEYKPLENEAAKPPVEEEEPVKEETSSSSYQEESTPPPVEEESYVPEEENSSKAPVIIGVLIVLVVLIAGFFIYTYVYKPKMEAKEKERQELLAREAKEREEAARKAREEEEARRRAADSTAVKAKPAIGEIVTLTERTQRYYVVITSSVDGDLAMDYAKKLSAKGVSTKIIPPFGKWNFYRLAIGDYDTFANAQTNADTAKAEYGDGVWVIKY